METPKIVVDEDWKSQVQAEKERLQKEVEQKKVTATAEDPEMPPASLAMLISTIATQAAVCLGQLPNPLTGKAERHLNQARHFIDTLQVLEDKTAGNRTAEESAMLSAILHELRMSYVLGDTNEG
jgi:hypothetical protein